MDSVAQVRKQSLADTRILTRAVTDSFRKLAPRTMVKNPVMFVVEVGAVLTTVQLVWNAFHHAGQISFGLQITLWLWFTVLFANFAEAMAEGRGKAQADTLRKARAETQAHLLTCDNKLETVPSSKLRSGDIVVVRAGDFIPGDGEVTKGVASVDESAITGESAPVIRESGGDRSAVTGGTRVLSDEIKVRITSNPGETFLDRMIKLVEGASRQKTPNEIALNILLAGLTIIFLLAVVTLQPDSHDDWWASIRNRHCRHGSHDSAERHRDVGTRRRSFGRRGCAAAGQDGNDYAGKPRRHAILSGTRN